jgi:hypothetical protein
VKVTVVSLDLDRKRIGLSMKSKPLVGKARPEGRGGRPGAPAPEPALRHEWQEKLAGLRRS